MLTCEHICHLPCNKNNDYNLGELGIPSVMTNADIGKKLATADTSINESWSRFLLILRQTVLKDRRVFLVNGKPITACINWLRDHIHEMKGFRHWEYDLKSYLTFMANQQNEQGFWYEITAVSDNAHITSMADPPFVKLLPEDGLGLVRLPLENDIEYLVVQAVLYVFQATGDEEWAKFMLPHLEAGVEYMFTDETRYDKASGLVKRPYPIDTWDFDPVHGGADRRIHADSPMVLFHGDNTGLYSAMQILADFNRRFGNGEKAAYWEAKAEKLKAAIFAKLWNGKFFRHVIPLNCEPLDGFEDERLSLSNAYALNRGIFTQEQAESVIESFIARGKQAGTFAEWFSVNPPYEKFASHVRDTYINGGIASFTAGELARGAFTHGYEAYGWDILQRLRALVIRDGALYFLYDPHTGENLAGGPSGWGAAAIMEAVESGLAGIEDADVKLRAMNYSPRWAVTGITEIRYITGYEVSASAVDTVFRRDEDSLLFDIASPAEKINAHLLLPQGTQACGVIVNGEAVAFAQSEIRASRYVDLTVQNPDRKRVIIVVSFR